MDCSPRSVIVKAGMTLDGKIATRHQRHEMDSGMTQEFAMTFGVARMPFWRGSIRCWRMIRRLHSGRRTSNININININETAADRARFDGADASGAKVVSDAFAELTAIVVSRGAPKKRVAALAKRVKVMIAPELFYNWRTE